MVTQSEEGGGTNKEFYGIFPKWPINSEWLKFKLVSIGVFR